MEAHFKSGFVAIVGPTNSGKSTLLNSFVGEKISIVSPKPQTTYHAIRGILTTPSAQIVFTDTPGFQNYSDSIPRLLNRSAEKRASECDFVLWLFDATEKNILGKLRKLKGKVESLGTGSILALNKVDKIPKPALLPLIAEIHALGLFSDIVPISALKRDGVDRLLKLIESRLPEGQAMYESTAKTDRSDSFRISEMIREKVYRVTHEEIPYSVYVDLEDPMQEEARVPTYRAVLHVDSSSRKRILIGKKGEVLKKIGTMARQDIEKLLKQHICLKLHVDVEPDWRASAPKIERYLELS